MRFKFLLAAVSAIAICAGAPLLRGADIALLDSDQNTVAYFANAYEWRKCSAEDWTLGTAEYNRYWMGWKYVLEQAGKDFVVIKDVDITPGRLQDFKLLILSNNFWLDDYQMKVITQWVRQGGRLLATFGTGYAGVDGDFREGGTNELHELWGDPSAKLNSSFYLGNPWVKLRITRGGGPAGTFDAGDPLDYQYMANVLIQRNESSRDISAFFVFNGEPSRRPAIFSNKHSKGLVVYYAFAPEYLVSMANDLAGHCEADPRYQGGAERL